MSGLTVIFLKGRERLEYFITFLIVAVLALATAGDARRTIVDGREVVEPVILGRVFPNWLFFVVFLPLILAIFLGVRYVLDRFWPEKEEVLKSHRYANTTVKGAWTAREYLVSEPPSAFPLSSDFDEKAWLEEFDLFRQKIDAWLVTATDATLGELLPLARELNKNVDEEAVSHLADAHERRGIPTLAELESLAEEIDNDDLREYLRERSDELKSTTMTADRVYERTGGGYVAWKGDDPEAGSPMDYAPPQLRTALDYLQAEEPPPMRFLLGEKQALAELKAYHAELARWLSEASDEALRDLVPAIRSMAGSVDYETVDRLTSAHEERGIPTLEELSALASELANEDLKDYVTERIEGP